MDVEWTDTDPETGGRRYVNAEKFARHWRFKIRLHRRADWQRIEHATRDMWETLLDGLELRYRRREGVSDEDLAAVKQILGEWKEPPQPKEDPKRS